MAGVWNSGHDAPPLPERQSVPGRDSVSDALLILEFSTLTGRPTPRGRRPICKRSSTISNVVAHYYASGLSTTEARVLFPRRYRRHEIA